MFGLLNSAGMQLDNLGQGSWQDQKHQANKASKATQRCGMGRQGRSQRGQQKGATTSDATAVDAGSSRHALRDGGIGSHAGKASVAPRGFDLSAQAKLSVHTLATNAKTCLQRGKAIGGGSKQVEAGSRKGISGRKSSTSMRASAGDGGHTDRTGLQSQSNRPQQSKRDGSRGRHGCFRSGIHRSKSCACAKASRPFHMQR